MQSFAGQAIRENLQNYARRAPVLGLHRISGTDARRTLDRYAKRLLQDSAIMFLIPGIWNMRFAVFCSGL